MSFKRVLALTLSLIMCFSLVTPGVAFADGCEHENTEWVVTKSATESEDGEEALICQDCGTTLATQTISWQPVLRSVPALTSGNDEPDSSEGEGEGGDQNGTVNNVPFPEATVTELGAAEVQAYYVNTQETETFNLVRSVKFNFEAGQPTQDQLDTYGNWRCDFVVYADHDVQAGTMGLYGAYGDYQVAFTGNEMISAGQEIELVGSMFDSTFCLNDVYNIVGEFVCGAFDTDFANAGTTLTIELRIWNGEVSHTVKSITHTFAYPAASVNGVAYPTLQSAVNAAVEASVASGNEVTVTLLRDVTDGTGIAMFNAAKGDYPAANGAKVKIDFGTHTYQAAGPAVGSTGTENQVLHLEEGTTVTLTNGSIVMADGAEGFEIFMQNYGDLTIDGMILNGTGIALAYYSDPKYQAYPAWYKSEKPQFNFNSAGVSVIRNSTIIMPGDMGLDDTASLTIEDDAVIQVKKIDTTGTDERYASANPTLTIQNGAQFSAAQAAILGAEQAYTGPVNGLYTVGPRYSSTVENPTATQTTVVQAVLTAASGSTASNPYIQNVSMQDAAVFENGDAAGSKPLAFTVTSVVTDENDETVVTSITYDVQPVDGSGTTEVEGVTYSVMLPIPNGFANQGENVYVTHTARDGSVDVSACRVQASSGDLYIIVGITHFSYFTITGEVPAEATVLVKLNGNVVGAADNLADAVANAALIPSESGTPTVELRAPATITSPVEINSNLTIDLGGQTLTNNGSGYAFEITGAAVTIQNGTINGSGRGIKATGSGANVTLGVAEDTENSIAAKPLSVAATGRALGLYSGAAATLAAGSTLTTSVQGDVTVFTGAASTFNVYGTVTQTCATAHYDNNAISGNGNAGNGDTTLNIYTGATVSSASATAIYLPQTGTTTISGGEITGLTAVYVKSGTVNVTGGSLEGTGSAPYSYYGNGGNATGDALVVDNCNYPGGAPTVSISGGTFTSDNAAGIGSYSDAGTGANATDPGLATVTATTDQIDTDGTCLWVPGATEGTYNLVPAVAKIGDTPYATLAAAIEAAADGDVIELVADDHVSLTSGGEIELSGNITITGAVDDDGDPLYTVYGTPTNNGNNDIFVKGSGTVTISNINLSEFGNAAANKNGHSVIQTSGSFTGTLNVTNVHIDKFNRNAITPYAGTFHISNCYIDCAYSGPTAAYVTKGIQIGWSGMTASVGGTITDTVIVNASATASGWTSAGIEIVGGNGDVTIDGCEITGLTNGIATGYTASGTVTLTDNTVNVSGNAVYASAGTKNGNASTIDVQSGTYTGENSVKSKQGNVEVSGGTFTGGLSATDDGTIEVSGGSFSSEVPTDYCAPGFQPVTTTNSQGLYGVEPKDDVVAVIGNNEYTTLAAAIEAAQDGDTIVLLTDVDATGYPKVGTYYNFTINKSITLDGGNHSITVNSRGIAINQGGTSTVNVTLKNLTVNNAASAGRAVSTRGRIGTVTLDNVTLNCTGGGNTQGFTVGGNQASAQTINIINGSEIYAGSAGYCIITFNPVNMNVTDSTLDGWASLYIKGIDGSEGSHGSVFTITGSELTSTNQNGGLSNAFALIKVEDDDVTVNLGTGNTITINGAANYQSIVAAESFNNADHTPTGQIDHCVVNISGGEIEMSGAAPFSIVKTDDDATINISGGTFTLPAEQPFNNQNGTVAVSGGTFNKPVPLEYCAEGFIPVAANAQGQYTVDEGSFVAVIDNGDGTYTGYESLAAAISAETTVNGCKIVLVDDVALTGYIEIHKNLTFDLNGHTITSTGGVFDVYSEVTIQDTSAGTPGVISGNYWTIWLNEADDVLNVTSGTITQTNAEGYSAIMVDAGTANISGTAAIQANGTTTASAGIQNAGTVNISGSAQVTGYYGVTMWGNGTAGSATLTMTGGTVTGTADSGITGNGQAKYGGTVISIESGTVQSLASDACAIYHPQNGVLTIGLSTCDGSNSHSHPVLSGASAVYIKCGTLNVYCGTLNATGAKAEYNYNGNGANPTGDAIVVDNCNYPGGVSSVNINGGTFNTTATGAAMVGAYTGNGEDELAPVTANTNTITLPEGEMWVPGATEGTYVIGEAVAKIGSTSYATLAAALAAATDGDTITMIADSEEAAEVVLDRNISVTLDLNGRTVTANDDIWVKKGSLTVVGSSGSKINSAGYAFYVSTITIPNNVATLTINSSNVTITGNTGIAVMGGGVVNVNAGTINGTTYAIASNGSNSAATTMTITGGTLTGRTAIYHPGLGTLTVGDPNCNGTGSHSHPVITGEASGIEMRSGTLNVYCGEITATASEYSVEPNGNGTTTVGAAIAVAQHITKNAVNVTLIGGTLAGVKMISVSDPQNNHTIAGTGEDAVQVVALPSFKETSAIPEGYQWVETTGGNYTLAPVEIPEASITFLGGSLRRRVVSGTEEVVDFETDLRFGFGFNLPEGAVINTNNSYFRWRLNLAATADTGNRIAIRNVDTSNPYYDGPVANMVITKIPATYYNDTIYCFVHLEYELNGQTYTVESGADDRGAYSRSVEGVCNAIIESTAPADEPWKDYAWSLLNAR